jgi:ABC-type phosphate transport system ATPase subunit
VDLILRTYNVPDGTLFVDGHDVNTVRIKDIREACAYVPQDNFLFSDTITNNIAFGLEGIPLEDIREAATLAGVDDNIIEFKDGYETVLGERGVTVSGGQKQRISIARALMKNAPILILDDSVSAVDTKTERVILDNLRRTRAGRTTILIAHRITTVERMDKIVFIDDGAVEHLSLPQTGQIFGDGQTADGGKLLKAIKFIGSRGLADGFQNRMGELEGRGGGKNDDRLLGLLRIVLADRPGDRGVRIHQIAIVVPDLGDVGGSFLIVAKACAEFALDLLQHSGRNGVVALLIKLLHQIADQGAVAIGCHKE